MATRDDLREERVLGLLRDMEDSIVEQEVHAQRLLDNLEVSLRNIVSDVDFVRPKENMRKNYSAVSEIRPLNYTIKEGKNNYKDAKRPWTEVQKKRFPQPVSRREARVATVRQAQAGDGLEKHKMKDGSDTSIDTTSSKVQQLRLFWDKFFLTETVPDPSADLIDKSRFLSEAKYEVLDKPKRKPPKKSASKILEKSIPPSRVPISFRMVPSKQNKPKKRLNKDESYSDLSLVLSREVSTCVAKIPKSSDDSSETGSEYSNASGRPSDTKPGPVEPSGPDGFKKTIYKMFVIDQINNNLGVTQNDLKNEASNLEIRKIDRNTFVHSESGRQMSYSTKKGIVSVLYQNKPYHSYIVGIVIRIEEAIFIDSSFLIRSKKPDRKPRKHSTLLPCYYCTIQDNPPVDFAALGDASYLFQPRKIGETYRDLISDYSNQNDSCRLRTSVSFEKITISSPSETDKTRIKLIICQDESITRLTTLVLFAFFSLALLGFAILLLKLFNGAHFFCQ